MIKSVSDRQHAVKQGVGGRNVAGRPARTRVANSLSRLVVQVMQLNGLLLTAGDALAAPANQTSARWQVLAAIEEVPLSVAQIARTLNLTRQSIQRIADLLEADGLASYEENPAHLRAKLLLITPSGLASLRKIQHAQVEWANKLGRQLDAKRLDAASSVLGELRELLQSDSTSDV